jgi:O-antigen ligase
MLGGRSGDAADQSAIDRLEAAAAAIKLLISYPIKGCGYSQFTEHHPLTAHNAYLLAASELGWPGLMCFVAIIYLCAKTMFAALRFEFDEDDPEGPAIKTMAMAMLAAFAGIAIGVFFLSWTYHFVLWIHFGLAGALYTVVRAKYPNFYIRLSGKELGLLFVAWIFILIAFTIHIKRKGCW